MPSKLSTEEFISNAIERQGDKFDYSKVKYVNSKKPVIIVCKIHGKFLQKPNTHMNGKGCPKCSRFAKKTIEQFIVEANKVYKNKFSYKKFIYRTGHTPGIIGCSHCGDFMQSPSSHLQGNGCPKCNIARRAALNLRTTEHFIAKAKRRHGDTYEYDCCVYKNTKTKVKIRCKKHGIFSQYPTNHYFGYGCPSCSSSKGELAIEKMLLENNVHFQKEYRFENCRNKKPLPFDFAIFINKKLCGLIEYNGIQHYLPHTFGSKLNTPKEMLSIVQNRDQIKIDYCKTNKIPLLSISYLEKDNVKTLVSAFIKTLEHNE